MEYLIYGKTHLNDERRSIVFSGSYSCWGASSGGSNLHHMEYNYKIPRYNEAMVNSLSTYFNISLEQAAKKALKAIIGNAFQWELQEKGGNYWIHIPNMSHMQKRRFMFYMFMIKEFFEASVCFPVFRNLIEGGLSMRKACILSMYTYSSHSGIGENKSLYTVVNNSGSAPVNRRTRIGDLRYFIQFNQFKGNTDYTYADRKGGYNTQDDYWHDHNRIQNSIISHSKWKREDDNRRLQKVMEDVYQSSHQKDTTANLSNCLLEIFR